MMKRILNLTQVCAAALAVMAASPSFAGGTQSLSGAAFHATAAADASCFNTYGYSGLRNDCSTTKVVIAAMPHFGVGYYNASVSVYGNDTYCKSVAVNTVAGFANGNDYGLGTNYYTPPYWQTLNLGTVSINGASQSIIFVCWLSPGSIVGSAMLNW